VPGSLEGLAIRIERQLLDAGIAQADFVAFSGGAYAAVSIALRARVVVPRLVLLAPLVGLDRAAAQGIRELAAAARSGAFDPRPSWLERMTAPGFAARDVAGAARVLAWVDAAPLSVLCDELEATAAAADLRPRLAELACPALVCAGTLDNAVPFASAEEIARKFQKGVLERLDGVGHALFMEEPARVFGVVADFLRIRSQVESGKAP
jgi:pimeloyl-ACP methyl ester carboxylesterase